MSVTRDGEVREGTFRGHANLVGSTGRALFAVLKTVIQALTRLQVRRAGQPPLVDTSGGTAGADLATIATPPVADTSSSGGATVASVDVSFLTILDAYATLIGRCNLFRVLAGMGSAPIGPGSDGVGTIGAIATSLVAASGDSSVSQVSVAAIISDILDRQRVVRANVDEIRRAVGLAPIPVSSEQGSGDRAFLEMPAIAAAAAVTPGAAATEGVAAAAIEAELTKLADNVALFAAQVDDALRARRNRATITHAFRSGDYAAGTSAWAISPGNGRIRRVRTVVSEGTTGAGVVAVELGGVLVAGSPVTVAGGAPLGDIDDSGEIPDDPTTVVTDGQAIEITSDGAATAGNVTVMLEIEPDELAATLDNHIGIG